jgi:pimeloyl-ACP methyl ester carboxylesterase
MIQKTLANQLRPAAPVAPVASIADARVAGPQSDYAKTILPRFSMIRLTTGVTLNYLEQGDRRGEPIILLHGYTDSWNSYAPVLPLMSKKHHIFALDQRGHGDSSKEESSGYVMDDFVADVIAFMDAKGIGKATLVGHSMGSMIGQLVAIQHPKRVARLVLVGSMIMGRHAGAEELNEAVQTLVDPIDPDFVREFQLSTVYGEVLPEFIDYVIAESLKVPAHVWRQALASFVEQDTSAALRKITAPTLILWGDQDTIFPRSDQERLRGLIPNATWLTYAETGHSLHWEQPERFIADLERFIQATNW